MKDLIKEFKWRTMDGRVFSVSEMDTKHVFNSMKMVYNHMAYLRKWPTVWFQHKYIEYIEHSKFNPRKLARIVVRFIHEIERRGDLPERYVEPYSKIIRFLLTMSKESRGDLLKYNKLLEAHT